MDLSNQRISSSSLMELEEEDCVFIAAMKLATGSALPMALRFAVELNLLQLIRDQPGEAGASASELAAQLPAKNPEAAAMIDRVLRLLAANSILTCSLQPHGGGGVERRYSCAGVEHVGGDMFVSVPKADAIFMKWICHDWSDSHIEQLLKNCYEALPEKGKVIVAESILPEEAQQQGLLGETQPADSWAVQVDVLMLALVPGGKERTEMEFHTLATKAGFHHLLKVCHACGIWIIEFHK